MTRLTVKQAQDLGILPKRQKRLPVVSKATWGAWIGDALHITIPGNIPSLNEQKKWHWTKYRAYVDGLTADITTLMLTVGRPHFDRAVIEITHYHRTKQNRDDDNYIGGAKPLVDALRYAGVLAEDNAKVLRVERPRFEIDRVAWRTEVVVRRWEGE